MHTFGKPAFQLPITSMETRSQIVKTPTSVCLSFQRRVPGASGGRISSDFVVLPSTARQPSPIKHIHRSDRQPVWLVSCAASALLAIASRSMVLTCQTCPVGAGGGFNGSGYIKPISCGLGFSNESRKFCFSSGRSCNCQMGEL